MNWRLAVDIGGTFTDIVLEGAHRRASAKVLTTPAAPEDGVLEGVGSVLAEAGVGAGEVGIVIHGTTLATNALIERKGAVTALVVTEGFRDSLEMAHENRFEQYDISMDRPAPLVPRRLRWPVRERMSARGEVLVPLDEASVGAVAALAGEHGVESIAIGLLHAYANPAHEERVAALLRERLPGVPVSLGSEVCPEIREYERQSTTAANAYVQPRMAAYLRALAGRLAAMGMDCPFMLMTSGGGLTDLETAVRFPVRLVESGPAGGAILAAHMARGLGLPSVLSFDMGGTTAKLCLIDDFEPLATRTFEVARAYRHLAGGGLPLRIPAIEMVEIGAGGGSIATVDALGRLQVGPESAGADPGPACYGRGGRRATVTDADLALGKIDPVAFAGGSIAPERGPAEAALGRDVGGPLAASAGEAAEAVAEVVDENMANAARVHAVERGKDASGRAMIAFGGAAPLHACRLAEKLEIDTIVVPALAGVGSAVGFLRAPVSYEVVRSRYMRLDAFDPALANDLLAGMRAEAQAIVEPAAAGAPLRETRFAYMRYVGQGHEITVEMPPGTLDAGSPALLMDAFEAAYRALYDRAIGGHEAEILSWTLTLAADADAGAVPAGPEERGGLSAGEVFVGPAAIVEDQTTIIVESGFEARLDRDGSILVTRRNAEGGLP